MFFSRQSDLRNLLKPTLAPQHFWGIIVLSFFFTLTHNSVHTRCIVETSGLTRGVCKNRDFTKFKGFPVEFL